MFAITDSYPGDAIGGCDFLTLAPQRDIIDTDAAGAEVRRKERVVICERFFTADDLLDGRVAISEQSIRALGALVGLVAPPAVRDLRRELAETRARLSDVERQALLLKCQIEAETAVAPILRIYVAADGTEHATHAGAIARDIDIDTVTVAPFEEPTNA